MMTSSKGNIFAILALCEGNSPVTGEFPSQRPVIWAWTSGWVYNRDAGDLGRQRPRYDVTVMEILVCYVYVRRDYREDVLFQNTSEP